MNILLIGSGGREHALALAIATSPICQRLLCVPGNPGMKELGECIPVDFMDQEVILRLCHERMIDLVVIGPEAPLVAGLTDRLRAAQVKVFGPTRAAARLEGSKKFTKELCRQHGISTAGHEVFFNPEDALAHIEQRTPPFVIKADGLAAGKGVTIATSLTEACDVVGKIFKEASDPNETAVLVEDYLEGEEASLFFLAHGTSLIPLAGAQDHKRAFDGDIGPNTGGMGAYSPTPVLHETMIRTITDDIVRPTLHAMSDMGTPFTGLLYAGLMITPQGPKLIEYNVRFGDPECQAVLMRMNDDLLDLLVATTDGNIAGRTISWSPDAALTVTMVNRGYPGTYESGDVIMGLEAAGRLDHVRIFHAGTSLRNGQVVATGGRVLNITASGKTVDEARRRAYDAVDRIKWPHAFYRRDIGWRAAGW